MKKVQSAKFVRKKRIYLKRGVQAHPFLWIEFLDDGSFSLGFMSKQVKFTEYGSAIQRGLQFEKHAQVVRRGNVSINESEAPPHYTFHPPRITQKSGVVHMVDPTGKIDEWEFDWFPVRKVDHILTVHSGRLDLLGTVVRPRKNFSIIGLWGRSCRACLTLRETEDVRLSPSIHKFGNVFIYSGLSAE